MENCLEDKETLWGDKRDSRTLVGWDCWNSRSLGRGNYKVPPFQYGGENVSVEPQACGVTSSEFWPCLVGTSASSLVKWREWCTRGRSYGTANNLYIKYSVDTWNIVGIPQTKAAVFHGDSSGLTWHSRALGIVVSLLLSHWGKVVLLVLLPSSGSKLAQWNSSIYYPVFSCVQLRITEKPVEHSEELKHHGVVLCLLRRKKTEGKEK